jgi:Domain of unknown function (DUF1990)
MHRSERLEGPDSWRPAPAVKAASLSEEIQDSDSGYGPLFHRRYRTCIRQAALGPEEIMSVLQANLNRAAPTTFARFQKVHGNRRIMRIGDEYVVRMPGPWDGPVRVVETAPRTFRLATLTGHLEAGQIEFRAGPAERGQIAFETSRGPGAAAACQTFSTTSCASPKRSKPTCGSRSWSASCRCRAVG